MRHGRSGQNGRWPWHDLRYSVSLRGQLCLDAREGGAMKRILFVDDDLNVLDGIRRMLYSMRDGWEMEFVTDPVAALQACERNPFDIVVSDLRMPAMDG